MTLFYWVGDLLIPFVMILFGLLCRKNPPRDINSIYGYRTSRSMASQEAWDYAHKRIGDVWPAIGTAILVIVVLGNLLIPMAMENLCLIQAGIGVIGLICAIPFIESELARKFDRDGKRSG